MTVRRAWIIGGIAGLVIGLGAPVAVDARAETDNYVAASQSSVPAPVPHAKFVRVVTLNRKNRAEARRWKRVARHSPSVQEALTLASITYGISRDDLSSTAWCESTHREHARNGQYLGLMQLGDGFRAASPFFPRLSPWSPYANVMAAAHVISRQGYGAWECGPRGAFRP